MNTSEELQAQSDYLIKWYKGLSDEIKNYWTFRWTRVEDPEFKNIYETMKMAEKLCKAERKARKESHGQRPESI